MMYLSLNLLGVKSQAAEAEELFLSAASRKKSS
jgi:hypothetical protein